MQMTYRSAVANRGFEKKLTTLQAFAHLRHITLAVLIARSLFAGYEIQMVRDIE